jgi:hypothetical protein
VVVIAIIPRPRWPHLLREVSRHGTVRWVVRIGHGARTPITAPYGSPEFEAQYHAAIRGEAAQKPNLERQEDVLGRIAANERRAIIKRVPPMVRTTILSQVPTELVEKERGCGTYVYFMRVGERMKIGMSKNVRNRAKEIQTGQSEQVEVIYSVKGNRELEKYFHSRFNAVKLHGEWFRYRSALKAFLAALPYDESEDAIIL